MATRKDSQDSHIGPGSIFEGNFYISGSLRIDGKFEGDIRTDDTLIVGDNGKLKTNVKARQVIVSGTMIGNIDAEEEVRLEGNGKLLGDIQAPRIHIAPGVIARGNFTITGESKQKSEIKKRIEEAYDGLKEGEKSQKRGS